MFFVKTCLPIPFFPIRYNACMAQAVVLLVVVFVFSLHSVLLVLDMSVVLLWCCLIFYQCCCIVHGIDLTDMSRDSQMS